MAFDEKDLLVLKEKIDRARAKQSELKGRYTYQMQQLEQHWGCKTIEEAQAQIADWKHEIDDLSSQIQVGIEEVATHMEKSND